MGLRFYRRIRVAPGFRVNLNKSGLSVSAGGRGHWLTFSPRGNRATVGLPGTGVSYTEKLGGRQSGRSFGIVIAIAIIGFILLAAALG
jgi:hypothetical protein